ncbi:DUF1015 domain-containing protein [Jatrophihabitans fulvus]
MTDAREPAVPPSETAGSQGRGLSLAPLRALRPAVPDGRLGRLLCPPYDVIDPARRAALLEADPDNVVAVVLPDPTPEGYAGAARRLDGWVESGTFALDEAPALYVYEMTESDGHVTRGLIGAVELRGPDDGVILPHENTMAGPVADRLAVMTATGADLEPIYLVYDGGGAASALVADADDRPADVDTEADGTRHRVWIVTDPDAHRAVADDLAGRHALIADGHHRYATYRERQARERAERGAGPWDRGLALLVDTSAYGPQVHPIHRVVTGRTLTDAVSRLAAHADVSPVPDASDALNGLPAGGAFAAVLTDGSEHVVVRDAEGALARMTAEFSDVPALADLDVSVLHRTVVQMLWELPDDVDTVGYAHDVAEAVDNARRVGGFAVLLRATPVTDVAAVAAAGARMPRKSTLFTPKPASGVVMRRLADQPD